MIPRFKDLQRFIAAPCTECCYNQNTFYNKQQNSFYCNECYSTVPFDRVKEDDIYFDTGSFVDFLQSSNSPMMVKRLVFLYMEDIHDVTEEEYRTIAGMQFRNTALAWIRKKYESYL